MADAAPEPATDSTGTDEQEQHRRAEDEHPPYELNAAVPSMEFMPPRIRRYGRRLRRRIVYRREVFPQQALNIRIRVQTLRTFRSRCNVPHPNPYDSIHRRNPSSTWCDRVRGRTQNTAQATRASGGFAIRSTRRIGEPRIPRQVSSRLKSA